MRLADFISGYSAAHSCLLLMERKVLSDISIGEITDKAGVNRTTYYRHFASKKHIIKYYYAGVLSEHLDTLDLSGGIYGTFLLWFSHGMEESPAQMCKASIAVLPEQFLPMLLRE